MTEIDDDAFVANTATELVPLPPAPASASASHSSGQPRLTNSMNPQYFHRSQLPRAYELQRQQKFGKDTVQQSFTCDKSFLHVTLHLYKSKFLIKNNLKALWIAVSITRRLWREWKRTKDLPFWKLLEPYQHWDTQPSIDNTRVDYRLALLFHYDFDLAAVQRFLGGEHVAAHRDPDIILPQVDGLLSSKVYDDFE